MKNINTKKLTILITTLFISAFSLTTNAASVEQAELIKAEKITHASLINDAQMNLKLSFSNVKLNTVTPKVYADKIIALQTIDMNRNKSAAITKAMIIAE